MQTWWAVFSGADKLDIGDKEPVAMFKHKEHANQFKGIYGHVGYIEPMHFYENESEAEFLDNTETIW